MKYTKADRKRFASFTIPSAAREDVALVHEQAAEKPSAVIPEAAKRLSGIHNPGRKVLEIQGSRIPGLRPEPVIGRHVARTRWRRPGGPAPE